MVNPDMHSLQEIFSQLSPEDEEALISFPYRAGLYVSFSDTTGGWEAQESEMQSLTNILRSYSEDFCKTEFSQKVLMECLRARDKWPGWSHNIDGVPAQAARIIGLIKPMFSEKELNAFRDVLVDIALAVAMAFREEKARGERSVRSSIFSFFSKKDPLSHTHISSAEKKALDKLCSGLGYIHRAS